MHAIDTPDKQFKDGNGTSELGTILPAWWLNQIQAELLAVLTAAGIQPNKAKTNQLADAIKQIFGGAVVNNLTSADADKPLSALMGKKLTEQIGALSIDSDLATRDLNTVNKAGLYGQTSSSNAQTSRNYPVVKAGSLLVMPSAYGVQQIYSVFDGTDIYARNQTGSGWTGWQKTNVSPGEMQSAVDNLERKLVNGSPAALDTIRELAAALGNDANFANKVLQQIAGKADKSSTRAGYGITDASEVAVLTGQLNHGGTIPLPPGYREDQCKWLVSMAEDDPNYTSWDISEGGLSKHYYYRCYTRGRTVIAKVYHGSSDQNPDSNYQGWVLGKVNYICIGVK
jgi:hypothetical protein|nr:MAG TPA: Long tail fiber proximal subunit [Caudoviricetes sp.]